jgi:hypothetical protein
MLAIRAQKVQIQINPKHYPGSRRTGRIARASQRQSKLPAFTMLSGVETALLLNFVLNKII